MKAPHMRGFFAPFDSHPHILTLKVLRQSVKQSIRDSRRLLGKEVRI